MCGITGITPKNSEVLQLMNECLTHRGPDWSGVFEDEEISIGHTLLAIRDEASVSKQPVFDSSPWVLAFNGQIYNTSDLIPLLENLDPERIDSDTHILYKTIEKYGWDFIDHVRGMFAIALYNKEEKVIQLYRDPSGQKILYYSLDQDKFIFASEIQALLNTEIERKADPEGIAVACSIGYIPGDKTMIKNVSKVRPSECITFDLKTNDLSKSFFVQHNPEYFPKNPKAAFKKLIREHLQSKERVSINLSGGLDSSLLLHEMKELGHKIHSYSTRFEIEDENINRDAVLAKRLAKDYGAEHTEINITKEMFWQTFVRSFEVIEEPNYNISLPIYLLTATKEGIKGDKNRVVLSGDGGDEIFGGYPTYRESLRFQKFESLLSPQLFSYIKNKRSGSDFRFYEPTERWLFLRFFTQRFFKNFNLDDIKSYLKQATKEWVNLYSIKSGPVYNMMILDRILWMAGENFIRSDKLYMSESLEMRAPLAYQPFREYIDQLIPNSKYVGQTNKIFLRELYRDRLPDYIINREDKTGWRAPVSAWYDKSAKKLFLDILNNPYLTGELIDWEAVRNKVLKNDKWPGKTMHLYLSLAILAKKYKINL